MEDPYQHLRSLFDRHLADYIAGLDRRVPGELYRPEKYILSLGGKRVRPLLALIACELMGGDPATALPCSLSVELFHNFSLIHDDILDAAPLRRGKNTVHRQFGNNVAILSGDVMLVKALSALEIYDDSKYRRLSTLLQTTAVEVCEGQQLDMNFEKQRDVSVEAYIGMITLKTAVLLGCSLKMGALCANAATTDLHHLYNFGKNLGIAFQLLDDLLDCFPSGTMDFGKKTGGDIIANKKTFLWLNAINNASPATKKELERLAALPQENNNKKIEGILEIFSSTSSDKLCREEADLHTMKAIELLRQVKCDDGKKEQLRKFAFSLLHRQS